MAIAMALSPPTVYQLRQQQVTSYLPCSLPETRHSRQCSISSHKGASFGTVLASNRAAPDVNLSSEDAKEKVRKIFRNVELSISAYDTAWVAMAPSPTSVGTPCFPGSLDWILDNQLHDGSWGLPDRDLSLVKDALSSTLACVLALRRWNVGELQIQKGLDFIASNFTSAMNDKLISPVGFSVIFPSLVEKLIDMNVNLHLPQVDIDAVLQMKDLELKRIRGKNSRVRNVYLAYISEVLGKSQDWEMVMSYQQKNGSLFSSPSTTAAAFTELQDSRCHKYLCSVLQKFGNAVPTLYPGDTHFRLHMVDILERLGINRHFKEDISHVLNETFRQWEQGHDEIFSDFSTFVMAFRLLRHHGYNVSSELLAACHGEDCCFDRFGGCMVDTTAALEVYKASHLKIYPHESYLDENILHSEHFLEGQISVHSAQADRLSKQLMQEIADTLNLPYYANLERLENRNYIKNHNLGRTMVLKSSLAYRNFFDKDLLQLAKDDFSYCQSIQNQEFKQLERWVVESRLDQLTFSRQRLGYCYFFGASTLFAPELADVRISWAKNGFLTTVVDDFFDVGSSADEQLNLIQLFEEWDANGPIQACSEKVQIIFSAVRDSIFEIGKKAYLWQGRDVTKHIVEIWLSVMKSMWTEAEVSRNKSVPTMEEYIANGYVSFALGPIVLPALYFVGPKLPEEVVRSEEYQRLFEVMSTCGRLLNDIQSYQRESKDGKMNAVSLRLLHANGSISKEDAIREIRETIADRRRELLRLVLRSDDSGGVPRECRDLFWKMSKVVHFFYMKDDGFTSDDLKSAVKSILHDPIDAA